MKDTTLNKSQLEGLQQKLQKKKENLEQELSAFAKKDPELKGDWDTAFPRTPEGDLEDAASDVEEYSTRLDLEFTLETQLKDVTAALKRLESDTYGLCENCGQPIQPERLEASPEARFCQSCNEKTRK